MIELSHIDCIMEVLLLALQMALLREGHLEVLFHMFVYLKNKHNSQLVLDPTYPDINELKFKRQDWKSFYSNIKEEILENAPEP